MDARAAMTYVETSKTSFLFFKSAQGAYQIKHPLLKRTLSDLCPLLASSTISDHDPTLGNGVRHGTYARKLIDYLLKTGALKWDSRKEPFIANRRKVVQGTRITYLGHTSILVESGKHSLLIDPMLYALTPRHWRAANNRQSPPDMADIPYCLADLPPIDAIAISHIHSDHFDPFTLFWFDKAVPICIPRVRTPLKNSVRKMGFSTVVPLRNWETWSLGEIRLVRIPSHKQLDTIGYTEQCTWLVLTPHVSAYFGTDIRLMPRVFQEVARRYQPDIAFLPASSHRHLGRDVTMGVDQALTATQILKPTLTVPYACWDHWWLPRNTENFRGTRREFVAKANTEEVATDWGPAGSSYRFLRHELKEKGRPTRRIARKSLLPILTRATQERIGTSRF